MAMSLSTLSIPLACAVYMFGTGSGLATDIDCGTAPALPTTTQSEDTVKGNLEGRAKFLSSLIGDAALGGQIESTRKELYQTSDSFFAARQDAYLAYIFCSIVTRDGSISAMDKIKAIMEFRKPIGHSQ